MPLPRLTDLFARCWPSESLKCFGDLLGQLKGPQALLRLPVPVTNSDGWAPLRRAVHMSHLTNGLGHRFISQQTGSHQQAHRFRRHGRLQLHSLTSECKSSRYAALPLSPRRATGFPIVQAGASWVDTEYYIGIEGHAVHPNG